MAGTRPSADSETGQRPGARPRRARLLAGLFALSSACAHGEPLDGASSSLDDTWDASSRGRVGSEGSVGGQAGATLIGSGGRAASGGAIASGARSDGPEVPKLGPGGASGGGMRGNGGAPAGGGVSGTAGAGGAARSGAGGVLAVGTGGTIGAGGTLTSGASNAGGKGGGAAGTGGTAGTGGSTGGAGTGGSGSVCKNYSTNDACSLCICANCASQVSSCYDSSDPAKNTGCAQIEACAETNHCASSPCYCGTAALCLGANGPCKSVIETVDGTTDALTINNDGNDTSRALGRANAIGLCSTKACKSECGLP